MQYIWIPLKLIDNILIIASLMAHHLKCRRPACVFCIDIHGRTRATQIIYRNLNCDIYVDHLALKRISFSIISRNNHKAEAPACLVFAELRATGGLSMAVLSMAKQGLNSQS